MKQRSPILIIFLTVFIDLVGFGIVLPLLPTYSESFGASGFETGIIMASFSAMQFLFAPVWGAWSDRVGRRPALLVSTAGAAASYALFAVGSTYSGRTALGVILASRVLAGICGANITVAQAYIADITPPEHATRRMGLIGMAFGLGFIIGPLVAIAGQKIGSYGPGLLASSLCAANWVFAWTSLPESRKPDAATPPRRTRMEGVAHVMSHPARALLVVIFFLATFGFTCFEVNLAVLVKFNFGLTSDEAKVTGAALFTTAGLLGAVVQSPGIIQKLRKMGESRLVALSLVLFAAGLGPMPWLRGHGALRWGAMADFSSGWPFLMGLLAFISIGSSLTRPPLFALLGRFAAEDERGMTFGVAQSGASLARIVGPPFAGFLYDHNHAYPYVVCAGMALLTAVIAWVRLVHHDTPGETAPPVNG
jgi:MFS transporter, DHA1 family, tetracycline resistance protein